MDQKKAQQLRKDALDLSIELLGKLREHQELTKDGKASPVNDAIYHAELAAELIAYGTISPKNYDEVKEYVKTHVKK